MNIRPSKIGILLIFAAAVGIGAFMLSAAASSHAAQAPTTTHSVPVTVPPAPSSNSATSSGQYGSGTLPPSIFSSIPCHRCLLAHIRYWS